MGRHSLNFRMSKKQEEASQFSAAKWPSPNENYAELFDGIVREHADQALEQGSDPDEARRARGEADFLTSRALKLAPDNDKVKKSRDEVVKLLGLTTN